MSGRVKRQEAAPRMSTFESEFVRGVQRMVREFESEVRNLGTWRALFTLPDAAGPRARRAGRR